eukprot:TRINITY_DN2496_c0_g1_i4.p1 TRINITY_DN2496_c0_g1~~TRINITY_DN2496_c0_g1_i4.p1  ORF type:complete len:528 (-),score=115.84 TRINITY_DN2496_c0_g1_i4:20-1525(-)
MYVFGGYASNPTDEFWVFDLDNCQWEKVVCTGQAPSPRFHHSCIIYEKTMLLSGGYSGSQDLNDFYQFNFEKKEWTKFSEPGFEPRRGHQSVIINQLMVVHGGRDLAGHHWDDIKVFDLVKKKWENFEDIGFTISDQPFGRCCHLAFVHMCNYYIFGGSTLTSVPPILSDFYRMNITVFGSPKLIDIQRPPAHSKQKDDFDVLPTDVILYLLTFLSIKDLIKLSMVSREFYHLSGENLLWKPLLDQKLTSNSVWLAKKEQQFAEYKKETSPNLKFFWKQSHIAYQFSNPGVKWRPLRPNLPPQKELLARFSKPLRWQEIRMIIMGYKETGKSATVIQFIQNHFIEDYDPTIEDSYRKQVNVLEETPFLFDMLDTAGQEEYSAMRDQYLRTGQAILLLYSVTSRASFDELIPFYDTIVRVKGKDPVPIVLVGNKADLLDERQVLTEEGVQLAKDWNVPFYEISAKSRVGVEESFLELFWEAVYLDYLKGMPTEKKKSNCITN